MAAILRPLGASPPGPAVENVAIARVLAEIGDLLEIRADNPFKIRAYRNASQVVRDAASASPASRRPTCDPCPASARTSQHVSPN